MVNMQQVETLKTARQNKLVSFFRKCWSSPLFKAVLFNFVALLIRIIFFDIKYEVSDDYAIDAILSGAYGSGFNPNLLFGNVILGYFFVFLYSWIPRISFYFFFLETLGFVSSTAILYILFRKNPNITGLIMGFAMILFFADDLYVLLQFTKIASAAGIAGGLLVNEALWGKVKHKFRLIGIGTVISVLGSFVRFTTVYIFGAFLLLAFVHSVWEYYSENQTTLATKQKLKAIGSRFVVCLLLVGVLFGLDILGKAISNADERQKAFNEYHDYRVAISDVLIPDYEQVQDEYSGLGLDEVDYDMLNSWCFCDLETYPTDLLEQVGNINGNMSTQTTHSISYVLSEMSSAMYLNEWPVLGLLVMCLAACILGKRKVYPLICFCTPFLIFGALIYTGRINYRVEFSVLFCAMACMVTSFCTAAEVGKAGKPANIGTNMKIILTVILLVFGGLRIWQFMPKENWKKLSDEEYADAFNHTLYDSGHYNKQKYAFPINQRKISPNLIERMENDTDHFYYVDFFTGIQTLFYNYEPWFRPQEKLFAEDYAYFGSQMMHHPGEQDALEYNGSEPLSPFKSLVNENILLVDNFYVVSKLRYIQKYYYPNAKIELVDEVDGFMIWNIYIPDETE